MYYFFEFVAEVFKYILIGSALILLIFKLFGKSSSFPKEKNVGEGRILGMNSLKLQAYERLVLFIDRINPPNLFTTLYVTGMPVKELEIVLISEIRAEYQHNAAQQLYVSAEAWLGIKKVQEQTVSLIQQIAKDLPEDHVSIDLGKKLLFSLSTLEEDPYNAAMLLLKQEMYKDLGT